SSGKQESRNWPKLPSIPIVTTTITSPPTTRRTMTRLIIPTFPLPPRQTARPQFRAPRHQLRRLRPRLAPSPAVSPGPGRKTTISKLLLLPRRRPHRLRPLRLFLRPLYTVKPLPRLPESLLTVRPEDVIS